MSNHVLCNINGSNVMLMSGRIQCEHCSLAVGLTVYFVKYSELINHLVQHTQRGDMISGRVFIVLNSDLCAYGDEVAYDVEYNDIYHGRVLSKHGIMLGETVV